MAAHNRCTAPMNAPGPPPLMPMRSFRFQDSMMSPFLRSRVRQNADTVDCQEPRSGERGHDLSSDSQHLPVLLHVAATAGKIVEGHLRRLDDVPGYKGRALGSALFGCFHGALPLDDRPTI